jgi:uncharacterized protein YndB with AHSA1/START domain
MTMNHSDASFVYISYIQSSRQRVWQALTDAKMVREYWSRHRNVSDWKPGSTWEHQDYDDASIVDIAGKVIEAIQPSRLVLTWSLPNEIYDPAKVSRVAFDIESYMDAIRLTVTHSALEAGSEMFKGVSAGWPLVISGMKTLLESGSPMPMTRKRMTGPPK